jgi:superfamily I DNA/RNA helicase
LIGLCFELIAAGTSAMVRGRADMSKGLIKIIKRASKGLRGDAWSARFNDQLDIVEKAEGDKITKRSRDDASAATAIEALGDRIECVRVILRSSGATSADDAIAAIERIFSDKDAAVTLSTVHRSKGDEADRVVILEFDRLISTRAQSPEEIEQEWNAWYVAYTRAKREIIEIPAPKRARGEG